jgi:4-amino-4-deoxy-L-arabinose transferase-like glycosyltransferase
VPALDAREQRPLHALPLLAVLVLALLLRHTTAAQVEDLRPWPDAIEYEEAARSLAEGRGYLLWMGGDAFPPRYPPGLSVLIAASLPLVGDDLGAGIWVVLASALAAVAGTYLLGRRVAGPACGLVAALLVAVSPLHVQWSQAVMSDVPASAAVVWLTLGVVVLLRRDGPALSWLALGVAAGLAASIRYAVLAVVASACVLVLLAASRPLARRLRDLAALLAGTGIGVVPMLVLNHALFGDALQDGYAYWVQHDLASAGYVLSARPSGAPSNAWFYARLLLGGGALYPPSAAALLPLGAWCAARGGATRRAAGALAALVLGALLALHLPFFWQWDRFVLPVLPLLAVVMALPFADGTPPWLRAAAALLVVVTLVLVAADEEQLAAPDPPAYDVQTLRRIAAIAEPNAAVIARSHPVFVARVLRGATDRVWVPLQADAHGVEIGQARLAPLRRDPRAGGWIRPAIRLPFRVERALATVEALCAEGRPVYLSTQLEGHVGVLPALVAALQRRFGLTEVLPADPYAVYRVACGAAPVPSGPLARPRRSARPTLEPLREAGRAEAGGGTGDQRAIVGAGAEEADLPVEDHRSRAAAGAQHAPREIVEAQRLRAGDLDDAVSRRGEDRLDESGGDVRRRDRLHQQVG